MLSWLALVLICLSIMLWSNCLRCLRLYVHRMCTMVGRSHKVALQQLSLRMQLALVQGKRYSLPNSRIMIHQPLGGAQGQAADIEIQANEILHHKLTLNGYLAEFTGQSMENITMDTGM